MHLLITILFIYFVGFCISVYLFKGEIGEETENLMGNNYLKTPVDICLKSMCWPGILLLILLFGPWMLLTELIVKLSKK